MRHLLLRAAAVVAAVPAPVAVLACLAGCGGVVSDGAGTSSPPATPPAVSGTNPGTPPAPPPPADLANDDPLAHGRSLAVDDAFAFVGSEEASLARFSASLASAGTPLSKGFFFSIVLDDTSTYAVRDGRFLVRVPKTGGAETILTTVAGDAYASELRIAGGSAYFFSIVTTGGLEHQISHCTLARMPLAGGTPTPLLTYDGCGRLVVDDRAVYTVRGNDMLAIPVDGTTPTVLSTLTGGDLYDLAQDATRIWVASLHDSRIFSVPKAGGAVAAHSTTLGRLRAIIADRDDLYWLEIPSDPGGVARADVKTAPKSGGPARTLLSNVEGAEALAVNTDGVYVAGLGALHRVARH